MMDIIIISGIAGIIIALLMIGSKLDNIEIKIDSMLRNK